LRIDILNNTEKLAAILNRMNEIESNPGCETTTQDAITPARLAYMYEVSENQRAVDDLRYSEAAYDHVKGLEESKNRTAKLDEILATPAFTSLDPSDKAALFTNPLNAADLIDEVSSEESYRSAQSVLDAYNSLKAAELSYNDFDAQLTQAIADGDDAVIIEDLKRKRSEAAHRIDLFIERLTVNIRGEEQARLDAVLHVLNGGGRDPETMQQEFADGMQDVTDRAYELGIDAADAIESFLSANREKTYAELLELANQNVDGASRNMRLSSDGYAPEAAAEGAYEVAYIVRRWLVANKANIEYANKAPESGDYDRRSISEKWDDFLSEVDHLGEDSRYYQTFQNEIPDSSGHAWVTDYRNRRTDLRTAISSVLAQSDAGIIAAYQSLTPGEREVIASYGIVDTTRPDRLRSALNTINRNLELELISLDTNYRQLYLRELKIENETALLTLADEVADAEQAYVEAKSEEYDLLQDKDDLEAAIAAETDPIIKA
ncbi:MAG: hypothetical protein KDK34_15520, partial [Leptospiraceae bacterium]|nr:hypothetical protein [Leptospiraceae bacterium]